MEDDKIEAIWVEVCLNKSTILLGNLYLPPSAGRDSLVRIGNMIEKVALERKDTVLTGDLNCNLLNST